MTRTIFSNGYWAESDCLAAMREIPDASVDMVLCDLPYGTTACSWDSPIPFEPLWAEYWRIAKPNAAVVLSATQPFASALVMSQAKHFKYEWVWDKVNLYTGALQANLRPLRRHETILVFCRGKTPYNKQMRRGQAYAMTRNTRGVGEYASSKYQRTKTVNTGEHNPCSIIEIEGGNRSEKGLHPTQKPVSLFEYLIRTYTNPSDVVLDNCAGSGTTAIAAENTGRGWICIERDPEYSRLAIERIEARRTDLFAAAWLPPDWHRTGLP